MEPMVRVKDLWKYYDEKDPIGSSALRGTSFEVMAGEAVALYGKSGSGKTTLLNILAGLDRPSRGQVEIEGQDLDLLGEKGRTHLRRHRLGFVFQFFNLLPTLTVFENVYLAMELQNRRDPASVWQSLKAVGLEGKERRFPHELSGGEQQRVAIARAIVKAPRIVLADEPTGNLDTQTGDRILDLLSARCREGGTTLVMATHSPRNARIASRVLQMVDGVVMEGGNVP